MDVSKDKPLMTAGLDLGDKYSYLCLIDQQSGEVIEGESAANHPRGLQATLLPERQRLRIAIETGTHSPWASRVVEGMRP